MNGDVVPLLDVFSTNPAALEAASIQQIVAFAGNGKLRDGGDSQAELRVFLSNVSPEKLEEYARTCLDEPFTDSGFVLQDVVNEIGRRLGFTVVNGRYRGVRNENGFDGIWSSNHVGDFVVETKTTAAYQIDLDVISRYQDGLIDEGRISKGASVLFAVGRQGTTGLEQQIRGSRYAWSMRVCGVDALVKLMHVNVSTLSDEVTKQIHEIFKPVEYTRVDPIVDIVFVTSEDKDEIEVESNDGGSEPQIRSVEHSPREVLKNKREQISSAVAKAFNKKLIKRRNIFYSDSDDKFRVAVSTSKRYESNTYQQYWYAYLQPMRDYLGGGEEAYMVYGCVDKDEAYAIPFSKMEEFQEQMNSTPAKENRKEYWHVFIRDVDGPPRLYLPKSKSEIDLTQYIVDLRKLDTK